LQESGFVQRVRVARVEAGIYTKEILVRVTGFTKADCLWQKVRRIDFQNQEEGFPAFIIMVMIALSYSISTGLAFGFISFVLIKVVSGGTRQVKAAMWVIAMLSVLFLVLD